MLERRLELLVCALELVHLRVVLFLVGRAPGFFFRGTNSRARRGGKSEHLTSLRIRMYVAGGDGVNTQSLGGVRTWSTNENNLEIIFMGSHSHDRHGSPVSNLKN